MAIILLYTCNSSIRFDCTWSFLACARMHACLLVSHGSLTWQSCRTAEWTTMAMMIRTMTTTMASYERANEVPLLVPPRRHPLHCRATPMSLCLAIGDWRVLWWRRRTDDDDDDADAVVVVVVLSASHCSTSWRRCCRRAGNSRCWPDTESRRCTRRFCHSTSCNSAPSSFASPLFGTRPLNACKCLSRAFNNLCCCWWCQDAKRRGSALTLFLE